MFRRKPLARNCRGGEKVFRAPRKVFAVAKTMAEERPHAASADLARRTQARALIGEMRRGAVHMQAVATLSTILLVVGYTRPVRRADPWQTQRSAVLPHESGASTACLAASVAAHVTAAQAMAHPLAPSAGSGLAPDLLAAAEWICSAASDTYGSRAARQGTVVRVARSLDGWTRWLLHRLAPSYLREAHAIFRPGQAHRFPLPHVAFISALSMAMEWPDVSLVVDLICGAPCVGDCPDSGVFRADLQAASHDLARMSHQSWNHALAARLSAAAGNPDPDNAAMLQALWARTQEEVADGWAAEIGSLEDANRLFGLNAWRAMERFGVRQGAKLRPCDNARASGHNTGTTLHERLTCTAADFPARAAHLFASLLPPSGWSMMLGTEDVQAAYRRIPCSQPQFTVFAQWDPTGRRVVFFRLQGFNFGLRSAVIAFNRVAEFITRAAARLFPLCVEHYFDDFAICEPSFARGGQELLVRFGELVGFPFSPAKSQKMAARATFLGVEHDFSTFGLNGALRCSVPAARLIALQLTLKEALRLGSFAGVVSPDSLLGKLQFALQWAAYRFGRAALQPLFEHSRSGGAHHGHFSAATCAALSFLLAMLPALRPRVFHTRRQRRPPVLVWSDAAWEPSSDTPATIGFVVFVPAEVGKPARWMHSSLVVPSSFMVGLDPRRQYIGQLELLGAVAVYYSLPAVMIGRQVLHFVDNTSALFGLIKGYSSVSDSSRIVHAFWALATGLQCEVWFEYVPSEANIADSPSRGDTSHVEATYASVACPTLLPPITAWQSVDAALAFAQKVVEPVSSSLRKRRRPRQTPL
jgi:hypothetical protein